MSNDLRHPYPANKIQVIHAAGSDYQIGFQHGEWCRDGAVLGQAKFFHDLWNHSKNTSFDGRLENALAQTIGLAVDPFLLKKLKYNIPGSIQKRIKGLAKATNQDVQGLLTSFVLPDLLPVVQSYTSKFQSARFLSPQMPQMFGCSSFVCGGDSFLVGRNLDFPGVCFWDRYPVLQMTEKKNSLRTIAFSSAGFPFAGVTGVNEEQIYVAVHQHYSSHVSMRGVLPYVVSEEILSKARNLDDAMDIIRKSKLATNWAFVIADGKTRDAVICECQPDRVGIRSLEEHGGHLTHTNFFQSPQCHGRDYAVSERMNWDNHYRNLRMQQLLQANKDDLDVAKAVEIICDHYDPYLDCEKVANRTISTAHNIQSLVLDLENMKLFMAEGDAPIHLREYSEFDLGAIFSGHEGRTGENHAGQRFQNPRMHRAKEEFVLSFVEYMNQNIEAAFDFLSTSIDAHFTPEVALVAGMLLMKLGRYEDAVEHLGQAREVAGHYPKNVHKGQLMPPEYFESSLYLARAHEFAGSHHVAKKLKDELRNHADLRDSNLKSILAKEKPYTEAMLTRQMPPYSIYALVE